PAVERERRGAGVVQLGGVIAGGDGVGEGQGAGAAAAARSEERRGGKGQRRRRGQDHRYGTADGDRDQRTHTVRRVISGRRDTAPRRRRGVDGDGLGPGD